MPATTDWRSVCTDGSCQRLPITSQSHWCGSNSGFTEGSSVPVCLGYEVDKLFTEYPQQQCNYTVLANSSIPPQTTSEILVTPSNLQFTRRAAVRGSFHRHNGMALGTQSPWLYQCWHPAGNQKRSRPFPGASDPTAAHTHTTATPPQIVAWCVKPKLEYSAAHLAIGNDQPPVVGSLSTPQGYW